jgi:hypothetical protein
MQMKRAILLVLVVALLAHGGVCRAQDIDSWDGKWLYRQLTSREDISRANGVGYILGVVQTLRALQADEILHKTFDVPANATAGQIGDIVLLYLKKHRRKRHIIALEIIWDAMNEAFPVKDK